jgi:hypothetical protein
MHLCVVSFKECWEESGRWVSYGGFPLQMAAIGSLFTRLTLVVVRGPRRAGGVPLPPHADVVALRSPDGSDLRRKLSVAIQLPYYVTAIARAIQRADVVHTPLPGDIPLLCLVIAAALKKPVIGRYGSSWEQTSETTFMNRLTKSLMGRMAGGRNVMLATGTGTGDPARNMHWLFATAISRDEIGAVRPDLDRAAGRPLKAAYVGRLSPEKGVRYLVEAMAQIERARGAAPAPVHLTLAGDGPERAALEARVRQLGCGRVVDFAGQLGRPALLTMLQQMDLCVLPSLTESFCKARLDAMLCGVTVLTTPVGFGEDSDAEALAARLLDLAGDTAGWPALRHRCRRYVESRTLEAWAGRIGEICAAQWNVPLVDGRLGA